MLMALYDSTMAEPAKKSLLELSVKYCDSSISVYTRWLDEWEELTEMEVSRRVLDEMDESDTAFAGLNLQENFR
ncbi:MAG: hypothetical protein MZV70_51260 [Desulfobacterales bacterium]|nr:hypothetical protein [Desulfobacterales bacterium]